MAGTLTAATIDSGAASTAPTFSANGTQIGTLCRAWVNFDGTTTPPTIRASFNVSSVTRSANGNFLVNFTNVMPDANFATTWANNLTSGTNYWQSWVSAQTTSSVNVFTYIANAGTNRDLCMVSVFR